MKWLPINLQVWRFGIINLGYRRHTRYRKFGTGGTEHDRASAVTGVVAGGAAASSIVVAGGAAASSILELRTRRGQAQILQAPSNLLSEVFDRPPAPTHMYPPWVIAFMHSVPPG